MAVSYNVKQLNKKQMKKVFLVCTLSAIMGTVQILRSNDADNSNSLLKENVEALTSGDASPCDNINGYKKSDLEGGWFDKKQEFYDCCYNHKEGYNPSGNCIR